jgi:hypothetical protein
MQTRHRCALESYPVFSDDCSSWKGRHVDVSPQLPSCDLAPASLPAIATFLNNSAVFFMGDSTSRRAARQLRAILTESAFSDSKQHVRTSGHILTKSPPSNCSIIIDWLPKITNLEMSLLNQTSEYYTTDVLTGNVSQWRDLRKLIVLHYSTWNLMTHFRDPDSSYTRGYYVSRFVSNITRTLTLLKQADGYDPNRDIILFRLPIAQGCAGRRRVHCNETTGDDAVNDYVAYTSLKLRAAITAAHPDVGLIDCFTWTRAPIGAVGRHKCALADEKGTHFGTDDARAAYVYQVLHAAKLFSCGKPAWPITEP